MQNSAFLPKEKVNNNIIDLYISACGLCGKKKATKIYKTNMGISIPVCDSCYIIYRKTDLGFYSLIMN